MKVRLIALLLLCIVIGTPLGLAFMTTSGALLVFVFFYPLFMSAIWMAGGIYYWLVWERRWPWAPGKVVSMLPGNPLITILIPCHNEAANGAEAILAALAQNYPNIEVIAINDGSTDGTDVMFDELAAAHPALRVIHLVRNQGKAMALRMGAIAARGEYIVCIDGDAVLEPDAAAYLVTPMLGRPRVGAVTGNPRIRTRSTLIGRIQVGEFSSIIGLIKRTQRVYGQLFSVSGVVVAFRRQALEDVGYWSLDMVTEDIDITWKLQCNQWLVFFEPRALCWILMPETLRGLWKQRQRWAQGGAEVGLKYISVLFSWKQRRLWPLMLDFLLSTVWAFAMALTIALWALGTFVDLDPALRVTRVWPPSFTGMILAMSCLLQFGVSVLIERRYEPGIARSLFWIVWYPFVYWLINLCTTLFSFPKVMLQIRRRRARWSSPDRGIKELT